MKWYIDFMKCEDDIERVKAISKWTRKQVMGLRPETITEVIDAFTGVIIAKRGTELNRHIKTKVGFRRKKLSFIPDLPGMSVAEHSDLDMYYKAVKPEEGKPDYTKLVDLMAVLYRPLKRSFMGKYNIEKYNPEFVEHLPFVEQIDMDTVNRALLFFSTIEQKLRQNLEDSLLKRATQALETAKKEANQLLRNSGGGLTLSNS